MKKRNKFDMKYFKEVFDNVVNAIIIKPDDSDADRAKKIIWYIFFSSIVMLCVVSWIIFVLLTFTTDVVKVPNVKNESIYTALQKMSDKKLVANVSPRYSEEIQEGIVFSQNPSQGMLVKAGRSVSLYVSLGSQKKSLSDFTGLNFFEINDYFKKEFPNIKSPFEIEPPVYEFNEKIEKGRIIKQEPKDGIPVNKVKKLKLWVSNGSKLLDIKNLKNYIGKNGLEVSGELADLEITYNFKFDLTGEKDQDMIVIAQSLPEGALIEKIIKDDKILVLSVRKYRFLNDEKIIGFYNVDIPKKPFPVLSEIKFKDEDASEKLLLKIKTKGGISLPVPYIKANGKIMTYLNGKLEREIQLVQEKK